MDAFIKTPADFRTAYVRSVLDWDLAVDSLESLPSSVTLLGGDIPREVRGGFLDIEGDLFLISSVSPGEGCTVLQLSSPLELFSRPRPYTAPAAGTTLGAFVAAEIAAGWRDLTDAVYALPYLEITAADGLPFVPPSADDSGYYVLTDFLREARLACGLELRFTPARDRLQITVLAASPQARTYVCGARGTQLEGNTYSRTAVAKVTTVQPVDSGQVDAENQKIFQIVSTDWYQAADGSVSSQEPAERASGSWSVVTVSEKNDAREAAEAVFGKNSETHKVEFWTSDRPGLLDPFRLRLPSGAVFAGSIQAVRRRRGDRRWLCQSGTLPTTLTDKVRKSSGGTGAAGKGSAARLFAVGDVFLSSRDGDPARLLGYGAWTLLASGAFDTPNVKVWLRKA